MFNKNKKGFAVFFVTILVLMAMFGIVMNTAIVAYLQAQILRNITRSTQAYYTAEAGIEDALLLLKTKGSGSAFFYNLNVGQATAAIDVSNIIGGSRIVTATGNFSNMIRKVEVVWAVSSQKISFHYGAQVGDGGMEMGSGSKIKGNVFSNGSVICYNCGQGSHAYIDNSIIVTGNGHEVNGLAVGGDAMVNVCTNSDIAGKLIYAESYTGCTYGSVEGGPGIGPISLPISSSQVQEWKDNASSSGSTGSKSIGNKEVLEIGPVRIDGDLRVGNGATLIVKGTIYVTGNIIFDPGSLTRLDGAIYSSLSGVIVADGTVTAENGAVLEGTAEEGSYILVVSDFPGSESFAISINNTAKGAIFYTNYGIIFLGNNALPKEVTGYKIKINNNAVIEYESGLENANFASGPGGGWQVRSWSEIE